MTIATKQLVDELCGILDKNKYLILSGGTAVGKTYVAEEIIRQSRLSKYNAQGALGGSGQEYEVTVRRIQIHPSYSYEEFVAGTEISTQDKSIRFETCDKIFLSFLKEAVKSREEGENGKYFLVLEDIGRGHISGIMGDALSLLEPHGNRKYSITTPSGSRLSVPPNFYIIATKCTVIDNVEQMNYGFFRHFYHRTLDSDYRFMSDEATEIYADYDISPNAMFYRTKRIVLENLRYKNQISLPDREKYIPGHGIFRQKGAVRTVKYQVLPMLKQYLKDGILDRTAKTGIGILESMVTGAYTKDLSLADTGSISGYRKDVTPDSFYRENLTHRPIVNLVARILTQGLLGDADIEDRILFHPGVLVRKSAKLDGEAITFESPGYLFVERANRDNYIYGTTRKRDKTAKPPRYFYSAKKEDRIIVNGIEYAAASEMQPKEYTRWSEDLNRDDYINERASSSPNSIMFRILRAYYQCLEQNYGAYLTEFPQDENIRLIREYAQAEFENLVRSVRRIGNGSDDANVNLERNRQFREIISRLTLFWSDRGTDIPWNGRTIEVEGVYKVNTKERYKEYAKAMEELEIHQLILQGPPGTSKTYSAREFLKYMGRAADTANALSDGELDEFQIRQYGAGEPLSVWEEENHKAPAIAWDIVQFHPSYGYEDFVRGIEVTTVKGEEGSPSAVSYDTVNKTLGKMAEAAARPEYENTKFFLVIDEINRANLATVFGELIYGLEYRGSGVATPYRIENSDKIMLPNRLYIIGTMNTADKSIGGIDYAIRRRFLFFSLLPDRDVILEYGLGKELSEEEKNRQLDVNEKAAGLFDQVEKLFAPDNLNGEYYKDDVQIGHTYFLVSSEEQLYYRFKYQILPILREYHKDGMFQFEAPDASEDGFDGLLECIAGKINTNAEETRVRDIFEKLSGIQ
jgi:GTPase subunit of restriction endonuclease